MTGDQAIARVVGATSGGFHAKMTIAVQDCTNSLALAKQVEAKASAQLDRP
jgi:hypothetical protein